MQMQEFGMNPFAKSVLSHFKDRFDALFHEYIFQSAFNTFQTEFQSGFNVCI